MASTLANRLADGPRKMLSAHLRSGETVGTKLSDADLARKFGREIELALSLARKTAKEAADDCDYANPSPISKAINPEKCPALARLLEDVPGFRAAYATILANGCPEFEVETVLRKKGA